MGLKALGFKSSRGSKAPVISFFPIFKTLFMVFGGFLNGFVCLRGLEHGLSNGLVMFFTQDKLYNSSDFVLTWMILFC